MRAFFVFLSWFIDWLGNICAAQATNLISDVATTEGESLDAIKLV